MKRCAECGKRKPGSEFHRNRASRDGLNRLCKPCAIDAAQQRHARARGHVVEAFCAICGGQLRDARRRFHRGRCQGEADQVRAILAGRGPTLNDYLRRRGGGAP
jgi:hypothetical protein